MTLEEIQEAIKKSHVVISNYRGKGVSRSYGSGSVIDMDEDFIYIITNEHITSRMERMAKRYGYYVRFSSDYEELNNLLETYAVKAWYVGSTYTPDYAVLKCDISSIPYEDRQKFKSIPKIEEIELTQGMPVYMYHMTKDQHENLKTGLLTSIEKREWKNGLMSYYTNDISVNGDSGSLVFTQKGQCLGMLVGSRHNNSRV